MALQRPHNKNMKSKNKITLIGTLGKDPEVKHLEGGSCVANFPIATNETWKDKNTGEKVTETEWHNIVLWRGLGEVAEKYLKKGNNVYIEGKLKTRSWTDRDGNTQYRTDVIGDDLIMLGSKPTNQQSEPTTQLEQAEQATVSEAIDDELPF